jgi:hypothetical protein
MSQLRAPLHRQNETAKLKAHPDTFGPNMCRTTALSRRRSQRRMRTTRRNQRGLSPA